MNPEEILKDAPKYPDRAMEEDEKKARMAGVYGGPERPEMGLVYMGPPDANSPYMQMAYMGPGGAQTPANNSGFAGLLDMRQGINPSAIKDGYMPDPQSKFCENCGAKNPRDGKFCETCGEKFKE